MRKEYRKTALALTLVLGLGLGGCQSGGGTENGGGENGGDAFQSQTGEGEAAVGFGAESAAAQAALAYEFDSADESQGKVSDYEITAEIRLEDGAAVIEGSGAVQEGGGVKPLPLAQGDAAASPLPPRALIFCPVRLRTAKSWWTRPTTMRSLFC